MSKGIRSRRARVVEPQAVAAPSPPAPEPQGLLLRVIKDDWGREHRYEIAHYPIGQLATLGRRLLKMGGTSGLQAISGAARGLDGEMLAGAVFDLCDLLEEYGDDRLLREILSVAIRDGQPCEGCFDAAYRGNLGECIEACAVALEHNFGPFAHRIIGVRLQMIRKFAAHWFRSLVTLSVAASPGTDSTGSPGSPSSSSEPPSTR